MYKNKVFRLLSWLKHLRVSGFRRDTWYFIFDHGIGDTYIACSLLPYLIEQGDKVSVFIKSKNQHFIPGLFSDKIQVLSELNIEEDLSNEFALPGKGHPLHLHPYTMFSSHLVKLLGYRSISLTDTYKLLLGLDMHVRPKKPVFTASAKQEAKDLFQHYELLESKTVIICPRANSVVELSDSVWRDLADVIVAIGLKPVFMNSNIGNANYQCVEFPLSCAVEFCNLAGYVVSLRSGFCDLIATSTSRRVIIYPDEVWYGGKLIVGCGLVNSELSDGSNLLEIPHNFSEPLTSLFESITQFFDE